MRCTTQYAKIDDGFAKAMTIAQYPQQLSDNFVATLLQQVPYIVLSIDITPVETEDAMREIEASQMKIDSEKYRANRRNVENLDFMATISRATSSRKNTPLKSAMPSVRVTNRYLWCF